MASKRRQAAADHDSEEADWIRRAAEGDPEAFRQLVVRHQDRVYGIALKTMRDADLAAEAAQDAFVKAYRAIGRFESRSRFSTWLYRITVNVCYDRLARRPGPTEVGLENLAEKGFEPAAGPAWRSDDALEGTEGEVAFEEALAALSDTYRMPFVLRQIEERSYADVAEILGITPVNAKVRVHRAREMMVAWLKQKGVL